MKEGSNRPSIQLPIEQLGHLLLTLEFQLKDATEQVRKQAEEDLSTIKALNLRINKCRAVLGLKPLIVKITKS